MSDLHGRHGSLCPDKIHYTPESVPVRIRPDPAIPGRDAPLGADRRCLHHHQCGPTYRPAPEVDKVPVGWHAVVARVLAHWRNEDTVPEGDVSKAKRSKE